ncbi:bifunctional phosphopantothenoylcysteine decarboxylase/phosphopantothenate synthase [Qipengyuania sp. JC766]|uniref:bifunctional phosphopantothenoylcysteine decarboxylase/phosphopantothenate synthase n=1 Tax=Qipengyuania sp. JC766 TaxID=3232139 RepID=UPI00345A1A76
MNETGYPRILLIVGGGIAAYKSCELVRLIRKGGGSVTCVVTEGGQQFVTPMSLAALSENPVYTTLWDLKNEAEMGHIQLSREADLVVVCPATANMLAKMATGIADDLATTLILATDKPVMAVPAMNVRMWQHDATQRNVGVLRHAGVEVVDPDIGPMACGEFGPGRLPEPELIWAEIAAFFGMAADAPEALAGGEDDFEDTLDDEANEDEPRRGGLGGLLSSIIPRGMSRQPEPAPEPLPDEGEDVDAPSPAAPLLARKGGATSAPPTDPDAINHEVSTGAGRARPEALGWNEPAGFPNAVTQESGFDPLDGQPAFETDIEHRPLYGRHVLVTAGPTHEPIDPVRYLANRSSGRQGFAIAAAAANAGARVTLVSGPVHLQTPPGVDRIDVESARDMAEAVRRALPADAAIMVAAVADWRTKDYAPEKMKKRGSAPPALMLAENPDILATVASGAQRPRLLVGFAAETEDVVRNAKTKRERKGVDWIVANDVSDGVMGGLDNEIHIVTSTGVESLSQMPKQIVAHELIARVADALENMDDE